jgi:hypothetical protein
MPELVRPDGQPATHDNNGIKVTMPFLVTISATFIVEARNREQAALAIQRATSFSAGITPYNLGIEMGAEQAPLELVLKMKKAMEGKG